MITALWIGFALLIHLALLSRAVLRSHREPASRLAWVVMMIGLPVAGILAYVLFGETSIGRRRAARLREAAARLPDVSEAPGPARSPFNRQHRIATPRCSASAVRSTASNPWAATVLFG